MHSGSYSSHTVLEFGILRTLASSASGWGSFLESSGGSSGCPHTRAKPDVLHRCSEKLPRFMWLVYATTSWAMFAEENRFIQSPSVAALPTGSSVRAPDTGGEVCAGQQESFALIPGDFPLSSRQLLACPPASGLTWALDKVRAAGSGRVLLGLSKQRDEGQEAGLPFFLEALLALYGSFS